MSGATKPKITNVDPNPSYLRPLQNTQSGFLNGVFNGNNPFQQTESILARDAAGALQGAIGGQPQSVDVMGGVSPVLQGLMGAQAPTQANYGGFATQMTAPQGPTFTSGSLPGAFGGGMYQVQAPGAANFAQYNVQSPAQLQFGAVGGLQNSFTEQSFGAAPTGAGALNPFVNEMRVPQVQAGANPFYGQELSLAGPMAELRNPYGDMGAMNPAYGMLGAMTPIFDRNLARAQATLNDAAPGRFSSAFVRQGQDLGTQALQDYNLFAQQTLQQGLQQQLAERQANLNFMLGSRGIAQDALSQLNTARIGARGVAQQGVLDTNAQALQAQTTNASNALQARSLAQQAAGLQGQLGIDAFSATANAANTARANQIQAALGFGGLQVDQQNSLNQLALGQRGQDIDLQRLGLDALLGQQGLMLGARGQDIDVQGLMASAFNNAQSNQLGARGQDVNALGNLWQAQLGASGQANQFALGARGLAQDAFNAGNSNLLAQQQLAQQGQLQGAQTYGQLGLGQFDANVAAQNAFIANLIGAGNFGLQQQQANVNPLLQLMLGGLQYGQPQPMNTVAGPSGLQQWSGAAGDILQGIGAIINPFGGR